MRFFSRRQQRKPIRVRVFAKTDVGRTREHNEDCFLVADLTRGEASLQPQVREHMIGKHGSLFMVADGMGGAAAGEVASQMGTESVFHYLREHWITDPEQTSEQFAVRLKEAVEVANKAIHEHATQNPELKGMGTTCTAVGVLADHLYVTQVGDSRAYLIRLGATYQLTKDQSLTQRLVDAGEITEEEAEQSDRRNIILQALGPDANVKVDLTFQQVRRGDTLVICSDGLYGQVQADEIGTIVSQQSDLVDVCGQLIDLANERGGPDNITAVVARFDRDGLLEPQDEDQAGYQAYAVVESDETTEPVPIYDGSDVPDSPLVRRLRLLGAAAVALVVIVVLVRLILNG